MPLGSQPDRFDTGLDVVPLEDLFEFDDRAEEVHVRKGLEAVRCSACRPAARPCRKRSRKPCRRRAMIHRRPGP